MKTAPLLAALLALSLSACASVQKLDAANDVHALLIAIRDDDRASFDAHDDRPALKRELEARMMSEAKKDSRLGPLAAILAPGLAEIAGEALVQPRVFKQVAEHYGYTPQTKIPGPLAISQSLKPLPDGRMCATRKKDGPCLLMFTKDAEGHWRLSGFEGAPGELNLQI
jgi:hypothetical protein